MKIQEKFTLSLQHKPCAAYQLSAVDYIKNDVKEAVRRLQIEDYYAI